ncbi:hypothetical protein O1611_g5202 [Lasiodiplodia mahajangana]|uniref:Uncharacterized protein n=1 Tax=Lasiodiplodia mahajangana TaxID=1108764 RepID=A0ACC2JM40_9PEZI|nr:hypothetical protein O1611_g5202 [Lasiodiplodia mahajangana]
MSQITLTSSPAATPSSPGIPFHENFRFHGRDTVLDDLHEILRPSTRDDGKSGQTSCVIHGISGVGKTQVALEYAYRYRGDYSHILWVRAESTARLSTSFATLRRSLMPNVEFQDQLANINLVRDCMVQNDRWLLIFDNAEAADLDLSLFWPPRPHGKIVVALQSHKFSHLAANDIHLHPFNEEDGARLILDVVIGKMKSLLSCQSRDAPNTNSIKLLIHRGMKQHILRQLDDGGSEKVSLVFKRAVAMVHETIGLSGRAAALRECEKALKLRQEQHYGELYKNLAIVKLYKGDTAGAEENARKSCDLCCSSRSERDASIQKAHSMLGVVLMNIGKVDEAFKLLREVYSVRKEILGETNLHTRNSLHLVAELYRLKGKMEEADEESIARARYHLALVINAIPDKLNSEREVEAEGLVNKARETRNRVASPYKSARTPDYELESFDFIVSLLAGRWVSKTK